MKLPSIAEVIACLELAAEELAAGEVAKAAGYLGDAAHELEQVQAVVAEVRAAV